MALKGQQISHPSQPYISVMARPTITSPFSLDIDAQEIKTIFATCISCFDRISLGSTDQETALKLTILRLRLTRWGETVEIFTNPKLGRAELHLDDLKEAKKALIDLASQFETLSIDTGNQVWTSGADQATFQELPRGSLLQRLSEIASKRIHPHQKPNNHPQNPLPVFGGPFEQLIKAAHLCVDKLEEVFPVTERLWELAYEERKGLEPSFLHVLDEISADLDPWIKGRGGYVLTGTASIAQGIVMGHQQRGGYTFSQFEPSE